MLATLLVWQCLYLSNLFHAWVQTGKIICLCLFHRQEGLWYKSSSSIIVTLFLLPELRTIVEDSFLS